MKRIYSLLVCSLLMTVSVFAQKELTISGGNVVSAMVCENSVLYVWGSNKLESNTGVLGVGSSSAYVDKPTEVTFFSDKGLYIRQVNCGSGAHFIAVDCDGKVWCWGNNSLGQCGTGNVPNAKGTVQSEPTQVKLGSSKLANTEYDGGGYLINVDVVYAGNNNSFAILGDGQYKGCLVGWGGNAQGFDPNGYDNAYGQLGCGNQTNQAYPVFVLDAKKQPLKGVVQVYAGDNCAYALVDEDGDGVGTVYSWGYQKSNGSLGRGATGGVGNEGEIKDPYARPVCHADGTPMDNITMLGCGDGEGYGLDTDGYIWSWGNSPWNNAGGVFDANYSWYSNGANMATPLRVRAGTTKGASNDGTYLLAKWVAGGQGFGMAITADNKPVAWGGGGCGDGGATGNGTTNGGGAKTGPEYILYGAGKVHDDVVLINRADTWGFYGRGNGDMYAWGCNDYGQLGIGGTKAQAYATQINPPANCNPRNPDPSVDLKPGNMTVCASAFNGQVLDAGFVIGTELAASYKITWYKDDVKIASASGLVSAKGVKYTATEPGTYRVEVEHVESGTGTGCVTYDPAIAEMTISEYPKTFTEPDEIVFCAGKAMPKIGVTTTNKKAVYSWYATESATTPIETTVGSEQKEFDLSTITSVNGKYIYVEETSTSSGTFIPKSTTTWTGGEDNLNAGSFTDKFGTGFEVKETITLTGFDMTVMSSIYNTTDGQNEGKGTITFSICGAGTKDSKYIVNPSNVKGTINAVYERTRTSSQQQDYTDEAHAEGSVTLTPGIYYIVPTKYASSGSLQNFKLKRGGSKLSTALKDDATGNILQFVSVASKDNPDQGISGYVYNIKFKTTQGYCDRIAIPIVEDCPCNKPDAITITGSDDDNVLCPGGTTTLTPTKQSNAKDFAYVWYKGSEKDANIVAGPSTTAQLTFEADEAATYIVKVYDVVLPNSTNCQERATIDIESADNPTVTIGKGGDYCDGDAVKDITLTFKGTAPFEYTYKENAGTAKSGSVASGTSGSITPASTVGAGSASTSYEYTIASLSDKYCTAIASGYAGSATVTIGAVPTSSITPSDEKVCEPNTITLTGATDVTGATLAWGGKGTGSGTSQSISGAGSYTYTLTATNTVGTASCKSKEASQDVLINAKPTVTVAAPETEICSGGELTVNATAKIGSSVATEGEYAWTDATGDGASVTVAKVATWPNPETATVSVVYTSADGCVSDESNSVKLTFNPKPTAPVATPTVSYCTTADPSTVKPLTATIESGATATWYLPDGSTSATAPTPSIAKATTTTYYVTQTKAGCESDKTQIDVIVNAELQPSFIMSAEEICENTTATITLGQADTYTKIEWSGDATTYFNGTKIYNPTFANADVTASTTYDFKVSVEDKNGCTGKATGSIVVNPVPTAALATPNNEHCITEPTAQVITATITPSMTGTGSWTCNNSGKIEKTGETTAAFTPSENADGSYTVSYSFTSDKGCATEKEATQIMIVNPLPTPSFTLSNNSVCVSGNNSDPITVTKTNPSTGTFDYAIDKGTIDATNGTFNPSGQSAGEYVVTLTYTDAKGCVNTTTNTFTVHDLPQVEINSITDDELCYNSAAVTLSTTVSPEGGNGVWSGSITSATFNPAVVAVGTNDMTYTYTDEFKCQNSDDYTITVKKPKVPTAGDDVNEMVNSLHVLEGDETLSAISNESDNAGLQWMAVTGGTVIQNGGNTFVVKDVADAKSGNDDGLVGSYPFAVRQMITVAGEGCYSDSVIVTLNVSKCNAMAPSVNFADRYICETGTTITSDFLTGTRVEGDNPPTNYRIAWLTENPVGKNAAFVTAEGWEISGSSVNTPGANAVPYQPSKETKDYFVAEYSEDEDCWSVGTRVSVHVVPNPIVSVSSEEDVCKIGTETIPVTISPAGGELVASTGTLTGTTWNPGDYYTSSDNLPVEFTYTYTTEPYSDGITCSATSTSNTTAHFMVAPDVQEYTWLIDDIANIPDGFVKGELSSTGKTMYWYADQLLNSSINEGTNLTLDREQLQADANGQLTLTETYWIIQKDDFGCKSEPSKVLLNLVDCPWEAPSVSDVEACLNKPLDNFTAIEGASVADRAENKKVTKWIWYKEGTQMSANTSILNVPDFVDNTKDGVTTFEVQYEAVESQSKKACLSPKTTITVTVYPLPVIELEEKETACYSTEEVLIPVTASSVNGTGNGDWSINGDADALKAGVSSAIFYPQKNGAKSGNYTVTFTYTDEKTCVSSKSHDIEVIYLEAPETTDFYSIVSQSNPVQVGAVKTTGDGIAWFEYAASTDAEDKFDFAKGSSADKFATNDNPNQLANKKYYARQYKNGSNDASVTCYSESSPAAVVIKICPVPNVEIANVDSCLYNGNPTLTAVPGEWLDAEGARDLSVSTFRFYESVNGKDYTTFVKGHTDVANGNGTYVPELVSKSNAAGYYYYFVSEYNDLPYANLTNPEGCESAPVKVVVNMKATLAPSVSAVSTSSVCDGDKNPSFRVAVEDAKSLIYWYEADEPNPNSNGDVDTLVAFGKGEIYTPINGVVGENDVYAVQFIGGCFSPQTKVSFTVKPNPVAPEPVGNEICYQELSNENRVIEAIGDQVKGYSITWYKDNNKTKVLKANSNTYQPADTAVGTYYYYAMQTVDGCFGPVVPVEFTVKPLPINPRIEPQDRRCTYDDAVLLKAEGTDVLWYASDKATVLNPGEASNEYQTEDVTAGRKTYYATQTVDGCEGPMSMISYMIYKQPEMPTVMGASICQGDTAMPTLSTDLLLDKWYADEDLSVYLTSGYTYVPEVGANEYGNKLYYVQREQNGCLSPVAIDTLYIVQHPVITIDEDRIMCVYDTIQPIKALDFIPAINDRSSVVWRVKTGKVSKYVEEVEGEGHAIVPSDVITTEGNYEVYASYRYVYDNIYCQSDEVSMNIEVKERARKPIVFTKTICQGTEIQDLQALGSPNVVWKSLSGTLPADYHGPKYKFQPGQVLDTGTYYYEIYDMNMYDEENLLGCESIRDTVMMIVAPGANTKLFGRDSVCMGSNGESYYTQFEATSKYFWKVTGDNLNYSKDASSSSVRYIDWMETGIDTLTVYEQTWAGCEGFDTLIVKVAPAPIARFNWIMPGAGNVIELTDSTVQDSLWTTDENGEPLALPIEYTLAWNFGHQGTPESQIDTLIPYNMRKQPIQEGGYLYGYNCPILTVTNDFGCKDVYSECIFVNLVSSLYVPTAFSPTNPAHAVRTFQPKGFNLAKCEISVYDKWGNLLWYSDEVDDGKFVGYWDGTYDGKFMKSDVYVWKMEATFLDGQTWQGFDAGNGKKVKFGYVTLVR